MLQPNNHHSNFPRSVGINIRKSRDLPKEGVLYAVHVRCVYWGDFIDLPTYLTATCMCFQPVKGITIAHTALCPLRVSPISLSWPPAGITVTHTRSNGDRVPATVISTSECGQYMSIEQPRSQGMTFSP